MRPFFAAAAFSCLATLAVAQPARELNAIKADPKPDIDGRIGPTEWPEQARGSNFFDEDTGSPAPTLGEFWLTYDEEFIYFAARIEDDPKTIQAEEYRDNVGLGSNDRITLRIDPTGGTSSFNRFSINPRGATSLDIAGGRADKTEWQGIFTAMGNITETGFEVEARIPWSIMDYQGSGQRDIRFNVSWDKQLTDREYEWGFNDSQNARIPYWRGVAVPENPVERVIRLLPYGYVGWDEDEGEIINAGFDFKTEIPIGALVGTVNPDFRNIENSILSLDFSRAERLADEARPFFQEGSDFRRTRLFASQRIDEFDAGLNSYGFIDPSLRYSILATADFGNQIATVGSFQKRLDDNETVSGTVVNNTQDGLHNTSYSLSWFKRLGDAFLSISNDESYDQIRGHGYNRSVFSRWNDGDWSADARFGVTSEDFNPRIGFVRFRDEIGGGVGIDWNNSLTSGPFLETGVGFGASYSENLDGTPFQKGIGAGFGVTTRSRVSIGFGFEQAAFFDEFDQTYSVNLGFPRGDRYRSFSLGYDWGRIAGMDYENIGFGARYKPYRNWQLNLRTQFFELGPNTRRQVILSSNYDIGKYESIGSRLVERDGDINVYFSWQRSGLQGAEYFVIFGDPNSRTFREQLIIKAVVPLEIKF